MFFIDFADDNYNWYAKLLRLLQKSEEYEFQLIEVIEKSEYRMVSEKLLFFLVFSLYLKCLSPTVAVEKKIE